MGVKLRVESLTGCGFGFCPYVRRGGQEPYKGRVVRAGHRNLAGVGGRSGTEAVRGNQLLREVETDGVRVHSGRQLVAAPLTPE